MALSLAALAAGLLPYAEAAVPAALAARTARAASLVGEGYSPMAAGLSSQVAGLVEVSLRRMCLTKLKVALAVLVAVLLCACTEGLTQRAGAADVMPPRSRETAPKAVPSYDSDSPLPGTRFAALHRTGE